MGQKILNSHVVNYDRQSVRGCFLVECNDVEIEAVANGVRGDELSRLEDQTKPLADLVARQKPTHLRGQFASVGHFAAISHVTQPLLRLMRQHLQLYH